MRALAVLALVAAASCERAKDERPPPSPPPPVPVPVDVAIAIDASRSMEETDLDPDRFRATTSAARRFVAADRRDRFAVVEFGQRPAVAVALARGDVVDGALAKLRLGDVPELGTAMGDAIALAVDQLRTSKPGHRALVVCGDGDSNWIVRYSDDDAAALAKSLGIPIYAIVVGDDSKGSDMFGAMSVETKTLSRIAAATDGELYQAANAAAFDRVFASIRARLDALAAAP